MSANNKRIECLDIARGIGILCMIAGHMGVNAIDRVVYTFHVPLFFLISGYLISTTDSFCDYAKKRFRTLIVPYIFTSVCLVLIKIPVNLVLKTPKLIPSDMLITLVRALYGSGANENNTLFGIGAIGAIWFLPALFWALLIVKFFMNRKYGGPAVLLVAAVSFISSRFVWLPWDIQAGGTAAVFVYVGMKFRQVNMDSEKIKRPLLLLGVIVFIAQIILNVRVNIVTNYYGLWGIGIIGAMLISYVVICISGLCEKTDRLKKILCFYGNNSIMILCFHLIEQNNTPWRIAYGIMTGVNIPVAFQYLPVFMAKVAFATICTLLVLKTGFFKKIFKDG